jgi:peptide/nickel transport system ATP-binding protein/oligopeptide transport system ATP-binding protein
MTNEKNLLEVRDLRTYYYTNYGVVKAVDGVSFSVKRGEKVAIIGESGAGKSQTGMSIIRLIQSPPGSIDSGEVLYEGTDLLKLKKDEMRNFRGIHIGMIFQEAAQALNPVYTVGSQIADAYREHHDCTKEEAWEKAVEALRKVQINNPEQRAEEYPHQFSGGMRQRAIIALAMVNSPDLLIADEPTTALDVTTEAKIISLIDELVTKENKALIFVTHDLAVAAELCDRFLIMYGGKIVETATVEQLFSKPYHPYTRQLLGALIDITKTDDEILAIPGTPPDPYNRPAGCCFHPRCPIAQERCKQEVPTLEECEPGREVACFYYSEYDNLRKAVN